MTDPSEARKDWLRLQGRPGSPDAGGYVHSVPRSVKEILGDLMSEDPKPGAKPDKRMANYPHKSTRWLAREYISLQTEVTWATVGLFKLPEVVAKCERRIRAVRTEFEKRGVSLP